MTTLSPDALTREVLWDVRTERKRQDEKWGQQNLPDGTGPEKAWLEAVIGHPTTEPAYRLRPRFQQWCQAMARRGNACWRDVLLEEVAEAMAESDPSKLRDELVQVAAVAVAWIEHLERRAAADGPT